MGEMQGRSPEEYRSVHDIVREDFRRATTQPIDLAQGPERREGQIARYSAPPPNDLRFELPTGPGFLEAFKKGLDTRPEFRGIPEAYMAHTSRISEGG